MPKGDNFVRKSELDHSELFATIGAFAPATNSRKELIRLHFAVSMFGRKSFWRKTGWFLIIWRITSRRAFAGGWEGDGVKWLPSTESTILTIVKNRRVPIREF